MTTMSTPSTVEQYLGGEADSLLTYEAKVDRHHLHIPGPDWVDRIWGPSDRNPQVLRNMQSILGHGRLANTGYVSILPVDQGIEHSAGASFAKNPIYFDGENIVKLAIEGGCNAVATTFGVLGSVSRRYAHQIPFIVKLNHNELMTYPNSFDQIMFGTVQEAWNLGAVAVGATIYFGSKESGRQIQEIADAFALAHELGMVTILWCYLRNSDFKVDGTDYHTGGGSHGSGESSWCDAPGGHHQAEAGRDEPWLHGAQYWLIELRQARHQNLRRAFSDHPIDLCRYQVMNCYMGRSGLINSGGGSGENDFQQAVRTAVINKRAGGMGLISARKAFQRPMAEGVKLLNAIQDVYLNDAITVA